MSSHDLHLELVLLYIEQRTHRQEGTLLANEIELVQVTRRQHTSRKQGTILIGTIKRALNHFSVFTILLKIISLAFAQPIHASLTSRSNSMFSNSRHQGPTVSNLQLMSASPPSSQNSSSKVFKLAISGRSAKGLLYPTS